MNVLQINTTDTRGGAAKIAYLLKKEFEKRGHKASMFVGEKFSQDENVFLLNNKKSFGGRLRRKLAFWLANDIEVFSSDKLLETKEFKEADVVNCHNLHSYYFNLKTLAKIARLKPVIWTFHDMWPLTAHCAHSFDGKVKDGFYQCPSLEIFPPLAWHNEKHLEKIKEAIYRNSNFHIVTPSSWLKEKVVQTILKDKPISLIYNGIDNRVFRPYSKEQSRQELGLPHGKKIILSVIKKGQSNPWKGADYLTKIIELLKNKKDVSFVCLGGNSTDRIEKVINIPYTKDRAELAKYYSAADILLYPSIADNCPLVVLEAMACGLPVVSFATGGIPELVEHKTSGYIAEYKNTNDLKTGLEYLLNLSPEETEKMRFVSTNKITENFTMEKMTDQYLSLYRTILNKKEVENFNLSN
jgi:glycosyltransferase involved in cell wall biosynthesis